MCNGIDYIGRGMELREFNMTHKFKCVSFITLYLPPLYVTATATTVVAVVDAMPLMVNVKF
jgi:hypothetical protein